MLTWIETVNLKTVFGLKKNEGIVELLLFSYWRQHTVYFHEILVFLRIISNWYCWKDINKFPILSSSKTHLHRKDQYISPIVIAMMVVGMDPARLWRNSDVYWRWRWRWWWCCRLGRRGSTDRRPWGRPHSASRDGSPPAWSPPGAAASVTACSSKIIEESFYAVYPVFCLHYGSLRLKHLMLSPTFLAIDCKCVLVINE